MYKITVNLPGTPQGEEVEIAGIGRIKNGSTYEVSQEEAELFRTLHPRPVEAGRGEGGETIYETRPGPTLHEAFKNNEHVTVETVQRKKEGDK
jgi:hypothetical protein